jgi:hypothetical protein
MGVHAINAKYSEENKVVGLEIREIRLDSRDYLGRSREGKFVAA